MITLTIGIPVYDDYYSLYFTLQSLRLDLAAKSEHVEYLVVDNNPKSSHGLATKKLCESIDVKYVPYEENKGTAAAKNKVFEEASSDYVLCVDSHVLFKPGCLNHFINLWSELLQPNRLIHGVLLIDKLDKGYTHMEPVWRGGMYGIWSDPVNFNEVLCAQGVQIPMHGMGVFIHHRETWPGFNKNFIGFGGEEGYIHEKVRQLGGDVICVEDVQWVHRFNRPDGVPYDLKWEDRIFNYFVGFSELDRLDLWDECCEHFKEHFDDNTLRIVRQNLEIRYNVSLN